MSVWRHKWIRIYFPRHRLAPVNRPLEDSWPRCLKKLILLHRKWLRPVKRTPAVASVGVQAYPAPVSEPVVPKVAASVVSPALGVATGVPLTSSEGPLLIPRGPEVVATPLSVASPVVGAQQVHPLVSAKPLDVVSPACWLVVVYSTVCSATCADAYLCPR